MMKQSFVLFTGLILGLSTAGCGRSGNATPNAAVNNQTNPWGTGVGTGVGVGVGGAVGCVPGQSGFSLAGRCVPGANLAQACTSVGGALISNYCRLTGPVASTGPISYVKGLGSFNRTFSSQWVVTPNDLLQISGDIRQRNSSKSWSAQVYVGSAPVTGGLATDGSGGLDVPFRPNYTGAVALQFRANGSFSGSLQVMMTRCEDGIGNTYPCQ